MERRRRNLISCLQKRQVRQVDACTNKNLVSSLSTRQVPLCRVLDRDGAIVDGHVVLGFSRCGRLLISYSCELDVTATSSSYTLHWWLFLLHSPIKHVHSEQLFRGESVPTELHLLLCQTPSPTHTVVVVGCKRSSTDDHQPCYVTIIPSSPPPCCLPSLPRQHQDCSIHLKFDLMPPYPSFKPSLSLKIPGWVILNTGDSLVALWWSTPPLSSSSTHSTHSTSLYSSSIKQVFGLSTHQQTTSPTICSPSHLLPVDVYYNDQPLVDLSRKEDDTEMIVAVQQTILDIEVWVNASLHAELATRGMAYHSLADYDLQLADVCGSSGDITILLSVLVEASIPNVSTSLQYYSVEVLASWNIHTGKAQSLYISQPQLAHLSGLMGGRPQWHQKPAALSVLVSRVQSLLLVSPYTLTTALSNHTVFSGKSLSSLRHPFLPLYLTLHRT